MARPKKDVYKLTLTIPKELQDSIEFWLNDPTTGKPRYGVVSHITTTLWKQLIRELEKPGVNPAEVLRRYGVDIGGIDATAGL